MELRSVIVNGNETIKLIIVVRVITMGGHLWTKGSVVFSRTLVS